VLYLIVMVVVAAAGITRLWLQQRREHIRLGSPDGFRESLERISAETPRRPTTRRSDRGPLRSDRSYGTPRPPLDPERRAAAKRRIEERRRSRQPVA
jgi:hypothetical protein